MARPHPNMAAHLLSPLSGGTLVAARRVLDMNVAALTPPPSPHRTPMRSDGAKLDPWITTCVGRCVRVRGEG
eukprot:1444299-Prymnesium_polylepis.1